MKNTKLLFVLGLALMLSGCMATLSPDGTITAEYIVPEQTIIVENESPRPMIYAHNAPRPAPPPRAAPPRPPRVHGPMGHGRF